MNVYTYFEDIHDFQHQKEMLDVWIKNWKHKGFNPVVLNQQHAKAHKYYIEFNSKCKKIQKKLYNKPLTPYGLSCYNRWLAYAGQQDEIMIVSDYDVVNINFKTIDFDSRINIMQSGPGDNNPVPCFATGTPQQFEKLAHMFVELTEKNISNGSFKKNGPWWHDQNAIRGNLHDWPKDFIVFSSIIPFIDFDSWNTPIDWREERLAHVSHIFARTYKEHKKIHDKHLEQIRIELMKELTGL